MITKEDGSAYEDLIIALKQELHVGVVTVKFVKKSTGETREMVCTLAPQFLPPKEPKPFEEDAPPTKTRTPNPDLCVVYDIQQEGWRSFRFDSVIDFRTSEGEYQPTPQGVTFTPNEK